MPLPASLRIPSNAFEHELQKTSTIAVRTMVEKCQDARTGVITPVRSHGGVKF